MDNQLFFSKIRLKYNRVTFKIQRNDYISENMTKPHVQTFLEFKPN